MDSWPTVRSIDRWMDRSVQKGTRATNYLLTIVDGDLTSNRIIVVGLWHGEGEERKGLVGNATTGIGSSRGIICLHVESRLTVVFSR